MKLLASDLMDYFIDCSNKVADPRLSTLYFDLGADINNVADPKDILDIPLTYENLDTYYEVMDRHWDEKTNAYVVDVRGIFLNEQHAKDLEEELSKLEEYKHHAIYIRLDESRETE